MAKKVTLLGSTGSIGTSALKVIDHLDGEFEVAVLAAHSNIDLLEAQARKYRPQLVAVYDQKRRDELKCRLPEFKIVGGAEGIEEAAAFQDSEIVLCAIAGTLGLAPTVRAIKEGKRIALANKEALVSGGEMVMRLAKDFKSEIIPVDSEHSALFQCLQGNSKEHVQRLILTASGGPFREFSAEELHMVTPEMALKHPNWSMGAKVTIDSSTLMNKGLELIEAYWLFGLPLEKIEVVVHPESAIHSLVEYRDGSMMAQMSEPSMLVPIQYALTYPERREGLLKPFDFIRYGKLQFSYPDLNRFPSLRLATEAIRRGKSYPCFMNGANEVLVGRFLKGQIRWHEIAGKLKQLMEKHQPEPLSTLEEILEMDNRARKEAAEI